MKRIIICICVIVCCTSCQKDIFFLSEDNNVNSIIPAYSFNSIDLTTIPNAVIGEQMPNPLEVENLRHAFQALSPQTKNSFSDNLIRATHKYIAFTPTSVAEQAVIQSLDNNADITLYYYPIDYEVSDGWITPDDRFMTNGFSYIWAYIPIDYDMNTIDCPYIYYYDICNIEDSCYNTPITNECIVKLLSKSYELCGKKLPQTVQTKAGVHPSGYVKFYDTDYSTFRAVDGFKVRAVRGLHECWMNCNSSGYFFGSDTFQYAFSYEFMFRRDYFEIRRDGENSFAIIKLSNQTGPVNVNFQDEESCFMATIDRAAIKYYYGNIFNLRRPPIPSGTLYRPILYAMLDNSTTRVEMGRFTVEYFPLLYSRPIIYLYDRFNSILATRQAIYKTTIYELAISSLWADNSLFDSIDDIVKTSYAKGIEWALTKEEYPSDYTPSYHRCLYTGVVQDLVDNPVSPLKECSYYFKLNGSGVWEEYSGYLTYNDYTSGISLLDIESAARDNYTWNSFKIELKSIYVSQQNNIDQTFQYWNTTMPYN